MKYFDVRMMKRIVLYVFGLFFLALGVSFSIQAALGVSPVSSLAYAFSLTTGYSVGVMTILANLLFIVLQAILNKTIELKVFVNQLIVSILFGFFMDAGLFLVQLIPTPESLLKRWLFLVISLIIVSIGLLGYFTAKLPLMPYDGLTYAISERFKLPFTSAKITSDLVNVCIAGFICFLFMHQLGSIGIGTFVAAYFIGKILGFIMSHFQEKVQNWVDYSNKMEHEEQDTLRESTPKI